MLNRCNSSMPPCGPLSYGTSVPNPMNNPISLASNSTLIPPILSQGAQNVPMSLTCATTALGPSGQMPHVDLGPGITVTVLSFDPNITYAVPGNSYPSQCGVLSLQVSVDADAAPGIRDLTLTNYGDTPGIAMPALLSVASRLLSRDLDDHSLSSVLNL